MRNNAERDQQEYKINQRALHKGRSSTYFREHHKDLLNRAQWYSPTKFDFELTQSFLDFQIRIFQHIKSMASTEQELIQVCTRVVDDDPKLLAELALLFQFER